MQNDIRISDRVTLKDGREGVVSSVQGGDQTVDILFLANNIEIIPFDQIKEIRRPVSDACYIHPESSLMDR